MMLAELQQLFHSWLVSPSDETVSRLGDGAKNIVAGLAVYQNNYRAQLVGCLESAFPQVRTFIGEDAFLAAAISHIDSHPPHAWTLDAYAEGFCKTLASRFPDNPDVQELGWIEQALSDSFIAPDAEPLAVETLANVDWDAARLSLTPSFISHAASTNAEAIWSALWEGRPVPEGEMLAEPGGLIVWRRRYICCVRQVDAVEYEALLHLQHHGSFAALCSMLVERLGDADGIARAGALLGGWLGSELIIGIKTG